MQVSTEGGEAERVRLPFQMAGLVDLSAAKSELLFQGPPFDTSLGTGTLWTMAVPGGQPRRIGNLTAFDATWAPGGERIYYAVGPEIRVARSDGSEARKILAVHGQPYWIRFSHDGQMIRFSSWDEKLNTNSLWEARADGSGLRRTLEGWNPSSERVLRGVDAGREVFRFLLRRAGLVESLAIREAGLVAEDDPEPVQLTVGQMSSQIPLPSTDGKKIFFIGASPRENWSVIDAGKKLFAPYLPGLLRGAAFSRDGSRLAYVTVPDAHYWQSKADGTDRRELTFAPMQAEVPWCRRWHADRVYGAGAGKELGDLPRVAGGGNPERLTAGENDDLDPSWSPNGDALAYGGSSPESVSSKKHPFKS